MKKIKLKLLKIKDSSNITIDVESIVEITILECEKYRGIYPGRLTLKFLGLPQYLLKIYHPKLHQRKSM